jgi:hypothetical protein
MNVCIDRNGKPVIIGHAKPPADGSRQVKRDYGFYRRVPLKIDTWCQHPERIPSTSRIIQQVIVWCVPMVDEEGVSHWCWQVNSEEDASVLPGFRPIPSNTL